MSQEVPALPLSVLNRYTGGHTVVSGGYIFELCPDHPKANRFGFVAQHRLVVERHQGHYIPDGLQVHHIDHVKTNNSIENLHLCTRSEHMKLHREQTRLRCQAPLTEDSVREALRCGSLKRAAATLGVHTQTIRNRYPELVAPYKRRSPCKPYSPEVVAVVLKLAANPEYGYREIAKETGVCWRTAQNICKRHGVKFERRSTKGRPGIGRPRGSRNKKSSQLG